MSSIVLDERKDAYLLSGGGARYHRAAITKLGGARDSGGFSVPKAVGLLPLLEAVYRMAGAKVRFREAREGDVLEQRHLRAIFDLAFTPLSQTEPHVVANELDLLYLLLRRLPRADPAEFEDMDLVMYTDDMFAHVLDELQDAYDVRLRWGYFYDQAFGSRSPPPLLRTLALNLFVLAFAEQAPERLLAFLLARFYEKAKGKLQRRYQFAADPLLKAISGRGTRGSKSALEDLLDDLRGDAGASRASRTDAQWLEYIKLLGGQEWTDLLKDLSAAEQEATLKALLASIFGAAGK